ncbi:DUF2017 domain-containing protein [Arthrobacter sp. H14]|uniref:DUF2017 domain-containing protein n=1 Tax=Arthrobacter sp. H14 TaxID=1312959 RepID=UPI000479D11A|nr:DUF2017 domain-containing protein [Arthrobacter sp. H14]
MAKAFRNTRKGITGFLEPGERDLVRKLFNDIITMLEPDTASDEDPLAAMVGLDDKAETPSDPALFRLLPNAVNNDDDEALEFRRLTERSLRETKIGALRGAALALDSSRIVLNPEQAQIFSRALNDVRLVLAQRLQIESAEDAERIHEVQNSSQAEDVESYLALVYNFTTWLQESLMQALLTNNAAP